MKFLQVRLTLTLTLTLTRVKAQALTLILPGGAAAEPQAGWARHSVTASGGRFKSTHDKRDKSFLASGG